MGVNGEFTATVTHALVRFNIYSCVIWLTEVFSLPSETQIQLVETVEVVTTEVTKEDKPSFPLAQSPPAENSAGPSVPESIEVKKRLEIINPHLNLPFDWEKSICVIVSKYFTWTKLFFSSSVILTHNSYILFNVVNFLVAIWFSKIHESQ